MTRIELKQKLKKGLCQILNDTHDSKLFCDIISKQVNFNGFNYYYKFDTYSVIAFNNLPIIKLSEYKKQ